MFGAFFAPMILREPQSFVVSAEQAADIIPIPSETSQAVDFISGIPKRIVVPSLGIDLSITVGTYQSYKNTWTVAKSEANYATNSPLVNNQSGKTIVYGHATNKVFGKLKNLADGDNVYVYTDSNIFVYAKASSVVIKPTDTDLFETIYNGPPMLGLLTCDGLWFQNRLLITLSLMEVQYYGHT